MRELIFRNLSIPASKKRDISIEEIVRSNGLVSSTKKRSIYFVRGVYPLKSKTNLEEWVTKRKKDPNVKKKRFNVLRKHSDEKNEDKLICKMRGSFYIVLGHFLYDIVFIHAIKMKVRREGMEKCI